jgi:hypothetical protein
MGNGLGSFTGDNDMVTLLTAFILYEMDASLSWWLAWGGMMVLGWVGHIIRST